MSHNADYRISISVVEDFPRTSFPVILLKNLVYSFLVLNFARGKEISRQEYFGLFTPTNSNRLKKSLNPKGTLSDPNYKVHELKLS